MFTLSRKMQLIFALAMFFIALTAAATFAAPTFFPVQGLAANPSAPEAPVGTAFTYQGHLTDNGAPANGTYDFRFILYDAVSGGSQVGSTVPVADLSVANGVFTAVLDFGSVFNGDARWLEIGVRAGSSTGMYTTLSPRQPLTAAPYALGLRPGAVMAGAIPGQMLTSINTTGDGVAGVTAAPGFSGVYGQSNHADGYAVYGSNTTNGNQAYLGGPEAALYANSPGGYGVYVNHADGYGFFVCSTGSETTCMPSGYGNGLEVGNAETAGVWVSSAGNSGFVVENAVFDGLSVASVGFDGVDVTSAGFYGLRVYSAGFDGVNVSGDSLAGYFDGSIQVVNGSCTGCVLATFAINTSAASLQPGDLVTIKGTRPSEVDSVPILMEVVKATEGQAVVGVVQGWAELFTEAEPRPDEIGLRLIPREGAAGPGAYVTIVFSGPVQVKAEALDGTITPGTRLTMGVEGQVRALQTREVEGMVVTEGAPVIGIALSKPDENGLVWVLVDLQ